MRAARAYRRAMRSYYISACDQEEARYHLATLLVERSTSRSRAEASRLLAEASADRDYPQASRLLSALATDPATPVWPLSPLPTAAAAVDLLPPAQASSGALTPGSTRTGR
jgi:hypothetical protein